jgi:hypothetical protein
MRRILLAAAIVPGAVFAGVQLVPYGHDHSNPAVVQDAPWPDAASRQLAVAACYDCHSNESEWPVYSYVAPMSWLVRNDVDEGRAALNFSEWNHPGEIEDAADAVVDGSMPPRAYELAHPDARLDDAERRRLVDALVQLGAEPADD